MPLQQKQQQHWLARRQKGEKYTLSLQGQSSYARHRSSCSVLCLPAGGLQPHLVHVPVWLHSCAGRWETRRGDSSSMQARDPLLIMPRRQAGSVIHSVFYGDRADCLFCFQTFSFSVSFFFVSISQHLLPVCSLFFVFVILLLPSPSSSLSGRTYLVY